VPFFVPYRIGRARTGLGLFATMPIKRGTWLLEYKGPLLTNEESAKREDRGARYLFEINARWTVDGAPRSNVARYANHSCKPNMEVEIVKKRILIRTIRTIQPGDELTYNYGRDYLENYIPVCKCGDCVSKTRGRGRPTARKKRRRRANGHANGHG
jgi:SET domain-containing protein